MNPCYPKGDLRRMLAVLGAMESLPNPTLAAISSELGFGEHGGHTVRRLIQQAESQAGVEICRDGFTYRVASWGIVSRREGALAAWDSRQSAS